MDAILTFIGKLVPYIVNLFAKCHADIQILRNNFEDNGSSVTIKNIGAGIAENIIVSSSNPDCYWDIYAEPTNKLFIGRLNPNEQQNYLIITPITGCGTDVIFTISWSDKTKRTRTKAVSMRLYSVDGCL